VKACLAALLALAVALVSLPGGAWTSPMQTTCLNISGIAVVGGGRILTGREADGHADDGSQHSSGDGVHTY
jgi:hypothetical protein